MGQSAEAWEIVEGETQIRTQVLGIPYAVAQLNIQMLIGALTEDNGKVRLVDMRLSDPIGSNHGAKLEV